VTDLRPFVKSLGGKTQLLQELAKYLPPYFGHYYEPFVGGGALFFFLKSMGYGLAPRVPILPTWATLNDYNPHLVAAYAGVRDNVDGVIECLKQYEARYLAGGADFYYQARRYGDFRSVAEQAAWYIFINKRGYNGLWRVAKRTGRCNVPHGKWVGEPPKLVDEPLLRAVSSALRKVEIKLGDFEAAVYTAVSGDLAFFDPPYVPLTKTASFTGYTIDGFDHVDQTRLRDVALRLKNRGVRVILSNHDVPVVRELYADGFTVHAVEARRGINSKASARGKVGEVVII
jgi:DNA adenine methylase